jgi:hypothetical protein
VPEALKTRLQAASRERNVPKRVRDQGDLVLEGARNNYLASKAGWLRRGRFPQESIEAALLQVNRLRCDPPLSDSEVTKIAASISKYELEAGEESAPKESQASRLVTLAGAAKLFHTSDGEAYAEIYIDSHREVRRLGDREFRHWLAEQFYSSESKAPSSHAMQDAIGVLEGQARYRGPEHEVHIRIARLGAALYLDLGDKDWSVVKITSKGWKIIPKSKVRFRRPRGLQLLPQPRSGGSIDELWRFVNVRKKHRPAVLAWLLGAFQFGVPFFVLVLQGEQGSAKSTTARALRRLVDPNKALVRSQPRDVRDLMIAARNGWVIAFDNISTLSPWLSDALCSLATGGGFATRELYSDSDEVIFDVTRPILLNGIEGVAVRGDLLDRSLVLDLPAIPAKTRCAEQELWLEFEKAAPRILGALLDAAVEALRSMYRLSLRELPRMADALRFAAAGAGSFGYAPEEVLAAIKDVQAAANTVPLDASPVVPVIRQLLQRRKTFKGSATELMQYLVNVLGEKRSPKGWPNSPQALSASLRRLAPNLRAAGVAIQFVQTSGPGSKKIIKIADKTGNFSDAGDADDAD